MSAPTRRCRCVAPRPAAPTVPAHLRISPKSDSLIKTGRDRVHCPCAHGLRCRHDSISSQERLRHFRDVRCPDGRNPGTSFGSGRVARTTGGDEIGVPIAHSGTRKPARATRGARSPGRAGCGRSSGAPCAVERWKQCGQRVQPRGLGDPRRPLHADFCRIRPAMRSQASFPPGTRWDPDRAASTWTSRS